MTGNDENEAIDNKRRDDNRDNEKHYWYRHVGGGPCQKNQVLIAYEYKTLFKTQHGLRSE